VDSVSQLTVSTTGAGCTTYTSTVVQRTTDNVSSCFRRFQCSVGLIWYSYRLEPPPDGLSAVCVCAPCAEHRRGLWLSRSSSSHSKGSCLVTCNTVLKTEMPREPGPVPLLPRLCRSRLCLF
jgi:hypothetical protein